MPAANEMPLAPLDLDDAARYLLHDPREIARVLNALADARALISAYVMPGALPCPTALLEVGSGGVLIDGNRQEAINQRIAGAHHLNCVSQLDRVRIQFRLRELARVESDGRVAFSAPLPESLLKLQRRELYRLSLLPGPPAQLRLPGAEGGPPPVQARVVDLSGGGLALSVKTADEGRFRIRELLSGCVLELEGCEPLTLDLEVAHLSRGTPLAGATLRVGCRFKALPAAAEKLILQYIFRVERQRNARERRVV